MIVNGGGYGRGYDEERKLAHPRGLEPILWRHHDHLKRRIGRPLRWGGYDWRIYSPNVISRVNEHGIFVTQHWSDVIKRAWQEGEYSLKALEALVVAIPEAEKEKLHGLRDYVANTNGRTPERQAWLEERLKAQDRKLGRKVIDEQERAAALAAAEEEANSRFSELRSKTAIVVEEKMRHTAQLGGTWCSLDQAIAEWQSRANGGNGSRAPRSSS